MRARPCFVVNVYCVGAVPGGIHYTVLITESMEAVKTYNALDPLFGPVSVIQRYKMGS